MKFHLVLTCYILIASTISALDDIDDRWKEYKTKFHKSYSEADDGTRKKRFADHLREIEQHNSEFAQGKHSWEAGINAFTDWTDEELKNNHGCLLLDDSLESDSLRLESSSVNLSINAADLPKEKDWRKENVLTPVKDQGQCGSCWAFAAVGALEAHSAIKAKKRPTSLSEQNIVDCSMKYGGPQHGCKGGTLADAFHYVIKNKGINTEKSYPYIGKEQECKFSRAHVGGTCKKYVYIQDSEEDVMKIVATIGPVVTAIYFGPLGNYRRGIFHSDNCNGQVNHAVLIVGYGEKNGEKYWIIKNSWGREFGDDGYFYLKRNAPFMCKVGTMNTYPVV